MWSNLKELFTNFSWNNPIIEAIIRIVVLTVVTFIFYHVVRYIIKQAVKISVHRSDKDESSKRRIETIYQLLKSFLKYITVILYIIFLLPIFGVDPATVFAGAGLIGIVVAFAFQDLLKDVVAGVFIVFEKTYEVGDYVEINGFSGNVIKLGVKTTTIKSFTGEICTINNRDVGNVANYSKASEAVCINYFRVAYGANIQRVYDVFKKEINDISKRYPEIISQPKIVGVNTLGDRSIEFQVNTIVKAESHWQFRRSMGVELVDMCKRNKIPEPFSTVVEEYNDGKDSV